MLSGGNKNTKNPKYPLVRSRSPSLRGVGKLHINKALYQAALKYYNTRGGVDLGEIKVLMLAPTSKAAYCMLSRAIQYTVHWEYLHVSR